MRPTLPSLLAGALCAAALAAGCSDDGGSAAGAEIVNTSAPTAVASESPEPSPTASPAPSPSASAATATYVRPVATFAGPASVTAAILAADRVVHDPAATDAAVQRAAQEQQRAYRQLVVSPAWRSAVFGRLSGRVRTAAEACVLAGAELRSATSPRPTLPKWRIVPAAPADQLLRFYRESAGRHGVHWTYLASINLVETRMGRLRGTSTAGARGPMQFLPSTWAEVGRGDIENPRDAIDAAARYLVRRGAHTSIAKAVRGYNPSDHYVRAVLAYARVLQADATAYRSFYHWQVYYRWAPGDVVLLEGYRG